MQIVNSTEVHTMSKGITPPMASFKLDPVCGLYAYTLDFEYPNNEGPMWPRKHAIEGNNSVTKLC